MEVVVYTHDTHVHVQKSRCANNVKERIRSLAKNGLKAKAIHNMIREEFVIDPPKLKSIPNTVQRHQKERCGTPTVSLGEMHTWLQLNSAVPDNADTAYVLNFETSPAFGEEKYFRFAVTTENMLANALKSHLLHADGT